MNSEAKQEKGVLEISDLELSALGCVRQYPDTKTAFADDWTIG